MGTILLILWTISFGLAVVSLGYIMGDYLENVNKEKEEKKNE